MTTTGSSHQFDLFEHVAGAYAQPSNGRLTCNGSRLKTGVLAFGAVFGSN
jgi:hypothetical protein